MNLQKLSPQQMQAFANYVADRHPKYYYYFAERGAIKQRGNELNGFMDTLRGVGDFAAGLFGSTAQNLYREFVGYQEGGSGGSSGGVTMEQVLAIQEQARQDAAAQQRQTMMFMGIGAAALLGVMFFMNTKRR